MIVEGHGEVAALPVLLRKIALWKTPEVFVDLPAPIRVQRDRFLNRENEFHRHLLLADAKCGTQGWILILLDADDDCPVTRSAEILASARKSLPHRRISVVLANREYEAWFIAAARSLDGCRGFRFDPGLTIEAEKRRNAKGWIGQQMPAGYGEVLDQPAFSARMDLEQAYEGSRSFRKLCDEWTRQLS